MFFELS
jgi:hypothetical protein